MADNITTELDNKTLVLNFNYGIVNGSEVIKKMYVNNLNADATDENLHKIGMALGTLKSKNLELIQKREVSSIF